MMAKLKKIKIYLPLLIFAFALLIRLWGINLQGETWDEAAYFDAGKSYLKNIKALDFNSSHWDANKEHPPVAKYIYGLVSIPQYINGETDYTNGRVASAIMGALTILIVFYLAKELFSTKVAVLSAIILSLIPYFIGLNIVYGLDTPTTLFFCLTLYLFIMAIQKSSDSLFLLSGISLGLSIATRFNNFLLFILMPIIFFILKGKNLIKGKDRKLLWYAIIIPFIAGAVLFLSWPWLWSDTINHWNTTMGHWGGIKEIFFGHLATPGCLYYLVYFFIATPVLILILLIPFFIDTFKNKNKNNFVILAWFLVLFLVTLSPTKQNGVRYIIAIYPAVVIMASVGFFYWIKRVKMIIIFTLILLIYMMSINIYYHPYYLTYYNELVGGSNNVYNNKLFPIGWWGEGVEEACQWVSNEAKSNSHVFINTIPDHTKGDKLRKDLIITSEDPDYIIINLNNIWYNQNEVDNQYELVHTIKSANVPFIQIYKRKK